MDTSYDDQFLKRCFKCDETVLKSLNVTCNGPNFTILWNEFQIFIHEHFEFDKSAKVFVPEFQISHLITSKNHLICLDCNGNIHTTTLKFKNAAQKNFKFSFQPREQGVLASTIYDEENVLCLKYESNSCFLSLHRLNTEFSLTNNVILLFKDDLPIKKEQEKYIIKVLPCPEESVKKYLQSIFDTESTNYRDNYSLVVITFDRKSLYGCLYNSKSREEHVTLVKLYSCPTEICDFHIIKHGEFSIQIGLKIGTIINLSLKDIEKPEIVHLNVALHKFLLHKSSICYTDGISMWKAENVFTKDIKFKQLFIKQVYDFTLAGNQIICTTFTNLIYRFLIDDKSSYLRPLVEDEYCPAEEILCNSDYLNKIMEEVKKHDNLIKEINKENNYITALSLANRQDIMEGIINFKVVVYQNYEDAITENNKVILTNDIADYFYAESFFFLVQISTTSEHNFGEILSESLDLWMHITLASKENILKTNSIKVINELKKISFLIPLKSDVVDTIETNVSLKITVPIPGVLDFKQKIWAVLYRKNIKLHSEHFIKFNLNINRQECLKNPTESLDKQILQAAEKQHGNLFEFIDSSEENTGSKEWSMFVRLPDQYQEIFKRKEVFTKDLNSKKVNYFLQQLASEDFLKSKTNLVYHIGNDNVTIEIYNDGFSKPLLKVSSENIKITLNLRNFLADLLNRALGSIEPGKEFIKLASYSAIENLQKAVKESMKESSSEEMESLIEQFERNVIGILPI